MTFPESPAARVTSSEIPAAIRTMAEQTKSGESREQLKIIEEKAKKLFEQLARMQETGDRWENMQPLMSEMGQLYRQASDIGAREIGTTNLASDIEQTFNGDSKDEKVLRDALIDIAQKADVNPANISMSSSARECGFFIPTRNGSTREPGPLTIDIKARNDAITLIDMHLQKNTTLTERQRRTLVRLRARLESILHTNSIAALDDAMGKAIHRQKTDYRPLRLLGAVSGTLLTAVGLGVFFRTGKLPWPTLLWGLVAAGSAYPDLFKSPSFQTLKKYQFLADNQTQTFLDNHNINSSHGASRVQELFDLTPTTKSTLHALAKRGVIHENNLQEAGVDGSLLAFIMSLPTSNARADFIRIFGSINDKDTQAKTIDYIKHRRDPVV